MGESLGDRAKGNKLKALQALVDALGDDNHDTDGVIPIFTLAEQDLLNTVEVLAREGYAEKTRRTILGGQTIPAYVITEEGIHYYKRILGSV